MKPMTGEIGKLSLNGKQVGGFKYWTAIQNRNSLETKVIASRFWLLKKVNGDKLQAEFYSHIPEGELQLVYSADAKINFPEYELNKMESKTIEIDLGKFDWLNGIK